MNNEVKTRSFPRITSFIKNRSCSLAGSADISGHVTPICVTSTLTFKSSFLSPQAWSGCPWQTWTARPERTTPLSSRPRTWVASWGGSLAPPPSTSRSLTSTTTHLCSTRVRDGLTLPPPSSVSYLSHSRVHFAALLIQTPHLFSNPSKYSYSSKDVYRAEKMFFSVLSHSIVEGNIR